MIRWILWLAAGLLLGGIVHLASILTLPRTATQDAFTRLQFTPVNAVSRPLPNADEAILPFMDPAFVYATCRYDLAQGPLKLIAPVSPSYTSVSFYSRSGVPYYAINDRAAGRRVIELEVMTSDQRSELPEEEDVTSADRLIVESPTITGLILLKALAAEPGLALAAQAALAKAQCRAQ